MKSSFKDLGFSRAVSYNAEKVTITLLTLFLRYGRQYIDSESIVSKPTHVAFVTKFSYIFTLMKFDIGVAVIQLLLSSNSYQRIVFHVNHTDPKISGVIGSAVIPIRPSVFI